jgi:hypothetical protein
MACRPPIIPKSIPYWKGLRIMTPQAKKRRQWAVQDSRETVAIVLRREERRGAQDEHVVLAAMALIAARISVQGVWQRHVPHLPDALPSIESVHERGPHR